MITFKQTGDFSTVYTWMDRILDKIKLGDFNSYGREGVRLLKENTPVDTGKTRDSWDYVIEHEKGKSSIYFTNSNINDGVSIAIILQYGHASKNGSWVEGIDYINPALRPLFEDLAEDLWREVTEV